MVIQSWLNLVEICLAFLAVILSLCSSRSLKLKGALLAIVVSAFTFWKTVLYVWYAHPFLTAEAKAFTVDSIKFFHFPTSFWLLCPLLTIWSVSSRIASALPKEKKA